jgi:epoxyqueuosine reductase
VSDPAQLSRIIKSKAFELGFQKVGIALAQPIDESAAQLDGWIKSGKSASMHWMVTRQSERTNIYNYFPEVKSIVSLAMNYFTGLSHDVVSKNGEKFNFSNYAWGKDYHLILKDRIQQLLESIIDLCNCNDARICVDTSPIMEKVWAQKAGLGWQGKHTNLITREFGSWLFLGEILLNVELEYDQEFTDDLCGTCTACIEACPTNALTDYMLDANKCISYLTIEHREKFTTEQERVLSGWIFGCDICKEVCPWNKRNQKISAEEKFHPKPEIKKYTLADWLKLSEDEFRQLFKKSPVKRTKHSGFIRNVSAVANSDNLAGEQ